MTAPTHALGGNEDMVRGAYDVKTFMEQPAEVWCRYVTVEEES